MTWLSATTSSRMTLALKLPGCNRSLMQGNFGSRLCPVPRLSWAPGMSQRRTQRAEANCRRPGAKILGWFTLCLSHLKRRQAQLLTRRARRLSLPPLTFSICVPPARGPHVSMLIIRIQSLMRLRLRLRLSTTTSATTTINCYGYDVERLQLNYTIKPGQGESPASCEVTAAQLSAEVTTTGKCLGSSVMVFWVPYSERCFKFWIHSPACTLPADSPFWRSALPQVAGVS